ncbi:M23 family metallopeptidase [Thermomonas hydrothermalis]|nr:M23 family metallopeptidase [Thermomonas hydrothermalis]
MTPSHRTDRRLLLALLASALLYTCTPVWAGAVGATPATTEAGPATATAGIRFPHTALQGAMVIGKVPAGSQVTYAGRTLRPTPYGSVVLGIGRDQSGTIALTVTPPGAATQTILITILPRDWPVEQVRGVPPATVTPPPELARRIEAEQAQVAAARQRDGDETGFAQRFFWPVQGRISGRFGHQRVYDGVPGAPHSGMDIAAPAGTPVRAPASGVVTFAAPDLYLTGGTVLLDHGHGISSNFLHLSRIDVQVGQPVRQGEIIGAVGATGRASGPHLHWGMNWFDVRIDPLLVLQRTP